VNPYHIPLHYGAEPDRLDACELVPDTPEDG